MIVEAEIERRMIEIAAEAEAEKNRREARGEADAIFAKLDAQARGIKELLTKQAEGYKEIVNAAGGEANDAVKLMLAEKIVDLVTIQVEAIKNIKIDKVTVWDSLGGKEGQPATANFLSGLFKSLPPLHDLFDMAGMKLPEYLGTPADISTPTVESKTAETENDITVESETEDENNQ